MIRAIIDFLVAIWKAILKLKNSIHAEQQQEQQCQQEQLQNQYDKIDEQHQTDPNATINQVANELNDRF
jgi:hypothetical protein